MTPDRVVAIRLILPSADERQLDLPSGGRSETSAVVRPMVAHRSPTGAGCSLRLQGEGPTLLVPAAPVDARNRLSGLQI